MALGIRLCLMNPNGRGSGSPPRVKNLDKKGSTMSRFPQMQFTGNLRAAGTLVIAVGFLVMLATETVWGQPQGPPPNVPPLFDPVKNGKLLNQAFERVYQEPWYLSALKWFRSWAWVFYVLAMSGAVVFGARVRSYKNRGSRALAQAVTEPSSRPEKVPDDCSPRDMGLILVDKLDEKELIDRLGAPLTTFRPSLANMIAGIILALLMVGGGSVGALAIMRANHKPQDVTGAVIWGVVLVGLVPGGIALLLWVKSVISRRVLICPGGFILIARGKAAGCCWDQISEMKVMEFASGKVDTDRGCTVRRQDGRTFVFTPNRVHGIAKLIAIFSSHIRPIRLDGRAQATGEGMGPGVGSG
jgi:hypothetical protein